MTSTTPQDGASFDVDAWLTEAKPPQRAVILYGRADLVSRLQQLEDEVRDEDPGDTRMGGSQARAELAEVRRQLEASKLTVHVRGALQHEREAIARRTRKPDAPAVTADESNLYDGVDEERYAAEILATACQEPRLTVEQAARLIERCGPMQANAIGLAIQRAEGEPIDVPLSRIDSGTTQGS